MVIRFRPLSAGWACLPTAAARVSGRPEGRADGGHAPGAYRGDVDMSDLEYIEACHGTPRSATPPRLTAVGEVLKEHLPTGKKVAITSLKANIGHSLEAAGLGGLNQDRALHANTA